MKTFLDSKESKSWKVKGHPDFAVIGLPTALGGITRSGQDSAPDYIRSFSSRPLSMFADSGDDTSVGKLRDMGNLYYATCDLDSYLDGVADIIAVVSRRARCVVVIGGDDSMSYAVADGLTRVHGHVAIAHYDAHTDTYGEEKTVDHANWVSFARGKLDVSIRQVGCRTSVDTLPYLDSIKNKNVFLSIDMDVVDPAFAPGVSCPVPMGMTPHELLADIYQTVEESSSIVGIALNEVNVDRDVNGATGLLAHSILWRTMSKIHAYRQYVKS